MWGTECCYVEIFISVSEAQATKHVYGRLVWLSSLLLYFILIFLKRGMGEWLHPLPMVVRITKMKNKQHKDKGRMRVIH